MDMAITKSIRMTGEQRAAAGIEPRASCLRGNHAHHHQIPVKVEAGRVIDIAL